MNDDVELQSLDKLTQKQLLASARQRAALGLPLYPVERRLIAIYGKDFPESQSVDKAADWVESEHPRDERGKFTESGQELTNHEKEALDDYTSFGFSSVNANLRRFGHDSDAKEISAALAKLPQENATFYRGTAVYENDSAKKWGVGAVTFDDLKVEVGETFSDQAFLSCSTDKTIAERFVNSQRNAGLQGEKRIGILFEIKGRASVVPSSDEGEHIFQPGTMFRVTNIAPLNLPKVRLSTKNYKVSIEEVKTK